MTNNHNNIVIMAGGVGSRIWPMSVENKPKQFIDVLGVGRSLLQLTYDRFKGLCSNENVWIVIICHTYFWIYNANVIILF